MPVPESMRPYLKFWWSLASTLVASALTIWGPETAVGKVLVIVATLLGSLAVYAARNGTTKNTDSAE